MFGTAINQKEVKTRYRKIVPEQNDLSQSLKNKFNVRSTHDKANNTSSGQHFHPHRVLKPSNQVDDKSIEESKTSMRFSTKQDFDQH